MERSEKELLEEGVLAFQELASNRTPENKEKAEQIWEELNKRWQEEAKFFFKVTRAPKRVMYRFKQVIQELVGETEDNR